MRNILNFIRFKLHWLLKKREDVFLKAMLLVDDCCIFEGNNGVERIILIASKISNGK